MAVSQRPLSAAALTGNRHHGRLEKPAILVPGLRADNAIQPDCERYTWPGG
jgi:hypothetical protein